jgi:hypothetical protein
VATRREENGPLFRHFHSQHFHEVEIWPHTFSIGLTVQTMHSSLDPRCSQPHVHSKITFRAISDESPHEEPVASRVGKPQAAAPQRSARRSSEAMWKGSGRTLFQTVIMENFKFTLFVVTPIVTSSLFWNDAIVTYIVKSRKYVTYPPEGERPPTNQRELEERIAEQRRARSKEGSPSI